MPVAGSNKRQAWTADEKWFAIDLKHTNPWKNLDEIILAVKAKYDRDVSTSTLHAWLKPETAAKIEQFANASGRTDAKRQRVSDNPQLEQVLFLWYQGHEIQGAAVTGDVLTQKAKELALISELEVSKSFVALFRIALELQEALRHLQSRPADHFFRAVSSHNGFLCPKSSNLL